MKPFLLSLCMASLFTCFYSCHGSHSARTICDSACISDTLKFYGDHPLKPYVFIIPKDCAPDSIIWSYADMGTNLKTAFDYPGVTVNKDFIRCLFKDTGYVYLLFNDCATGRGFQLKLPYNKTVSMSKRSSGINSLDPKFDIAENMIAYTDRGNIYVEEPATGKKAMMTFGEATEMDYDAIHKTLDSVQVTDKRIWVKIKLDKKWVELEKNIVLE